MNDDRKQSARSNYKNDEEDQNKEDKKKVNKEDVEDETSQVARLSDHEAMMKEKRRVQQSRGSHSVQREPAARQKAVLVSAAAAAESLSGEMMHAFTGEMSLRNAKASESSKDHAVLHERLGKLTHCNETDTNINLVNRGVLSQVVVTPDGKNQGTLSAHERMILEKTRVKNEMAQGLRRKVEQDRKQAASTTATAAVSVDSSDSVMMRAKNREKANRMAALAAAGKGVARITRDSSGLSQLSASIHSSESTIEEDKKIKVSFKTSPSISVSDVRAVASVASVTSSEARTSTPFDNEMIEKQRAKVNRTATLSRPGVAWIDHPSQRSQRCSQKSMDSSRAASVASNEEGSLGIDEGSTSKKIIRASNMPAPVPTASVARSNNSAEDHDRMVREKRAIVGQVLEWASGNSRDATSDHATAGSGPSTSSESAWQSPTSAPRNVLDRAGASNRSASSYHGRDGESTRSVAGSEGQLYQEKRFRSYLRDGLEEQMALTTPERAPTLVEASPAEVHPSSFATISELAPVAPNSARDLPSYDEASIHSEHSNPEIEAQVGLPVIFPGAFAITGMDHANDDGYISADIQSVTTDYMEESQNMHDLEVQMPDEATGEVAAFEATLAEAAVTVEGAVIEHDDEFDKTTLRRVRTMQYVICMLVICAAALVTISVLQRLSGATAEKPIPTVEGWVAVGSTVVGPIEEASTQFGTALDMTRDGKKLAVVAPGSDDGMFSNVGALYLFQEKEGPNGTEWEVLTENMKGPGEQRSTFASLAMSTEPVYIAVGYPDYENGVVMIYKENTELNGIDFDVQLASNSTESVWFGYSVDISHDGNILAIGAPRSSTGNTTQVGAVHVFQRNGKEWIQLDEFSGWSVSVVNSDGRIRLAVGSPVLADFTGRVRVFDWTGTSWKQTRYSLEGESNLNRFGDSVDFSRDGTVLAVGARGTFYESPGYVTIFMEENGIWALKGDRIRGTTEGEGFGADIALSEDGKVIAVGAPSNEDFGKGSGSIRVYEFDAAAASWGQLGSPIGGQPRGEYGSSLALDGNGMRVAGGAPLADFDGRVTRTGSVGVFDRTQ